jgi:hypothetical protein
MKGMLSVAAGLTAVVLALTAPAALAEPGPSSDWFERTAAAAIGDAGPTPYADAFERPDTANRGPEVAPDWFERAAGTAIRNAGAAPYVDAFERPEITPTQSTSPTAVDSDSGRAWLELGIAFAVGLTLALGLVALVRLRPHRPLAQ